MQSELCSLAPSEWQIKSVAEVCSRVTSGGTPSRANPEYYVGGNWCWVKTQELQDTWIDTTEEKITEEAIQNSSAKVLPANTILLAMYGATVGQLGILRKPMTCNQACCALIIDPNEADYRYLFYILQHTRVWLKGLATGAAQQNLSGALIKSLQYPFPPLQTQRRIADILGTLDDKIELNRRMNATLEDMARTLFKSWFVDFDPVRAKMEGRQPAGMDADTAALFPDGFEDSELGEVPSGWRGIPLRSIVEFSRESVNPANFQDEVFDHYSLPSFDEGRKPKSEFGGDIKSNKLVVYPNSVLLSKLNPHIPRIWLPDLNRSRRSICSTEFIVANPMSGYSREFIYSLFTSSTFASVYATLVTGTTGSHQRINAESVLALNVISPHSKVVSLFTTKSKPIFDQINRNTAESQTLATLRVTLLPKLMGGEVGVDNRGRIEIYE